MQWEKDLLAKFLKKNTTDQVLSVQQRLQLDACDSIGFNKDSKTASTDQEEPTTALLDRHTN